MVKSRVTRWDKFTTDEIVRHMWRINRDPSTWKGYRLKDSNFFLLAESLWGTSATLRDSMRLHTMYFGNDKRLKDKFREKLGERLKTLRTPTRSSTPRIKGPKYCICSRVFQEGDDGPLERDPSMVECTKCFRWYHCVCLLENTEKVAANPSYRCPKCRNQSNIRFPVIRIAKLPVTYVEYQVLSDVSEVFTPGSFAGERYQASEGAGESTSFGSKTTLVTTTGSTEEPLVTIHSTGPRVYAGSREISAADFMIPIEDADRMGSYVVMSDAEVRTEVKPFTAEMNCDQAETTMTTPTNNPLGNMQTAKCDFFSDSPETSLADYFTMISDEEANVFDEANQDDVIFKPPGIAKRINVTSNEPPDEPMKNSKYFTIEIPESDWTHRLYLRKRGWGVRHLGDLLRPYLEVHAGTCPMILQYHKLRDGWLVYFSAKITCKDSNCYVWILQSACAPAKGGTVSIRVYWDKPYKRHDPEFSYTFPLKGKNRDKVQHEMLTTNSKAAAYATKMYRKTNKAEIYEGNMTSLRKRNIYRQALYEAKLKLDHAKDAVDDVKFQLIAEKAINDPFIQSYCIDPLRVVTFTLAGLQLLEKMRSIAHHHLVVNFDATGTLIAPLRSTIVEKGRIYVYSMTIKHPKKGIPPLSLAEFIMNSHSISDIAGALNVFLKKANAHLKTNKSAIFKRYEVDFSEAMIGAVLEATLHTNMRDFLDRCWDVLLCRRKAHSVNVHVCRTHNCRNQHARIMQYYKDNPLNEENVTNLENLLFQWFKCDSFGGLAYRSEKLLTLLTAPHIEDIEDILHDVHARTPVTYVEDHEDEWLYHDTDRRIDNTIHRSTAFGSFFHSMNDRISDQTWTTVGNPNPFRNDQYKEYLLVWFFPYAPLHTHVMFSATKDKKIDDHQTPVEQWFRSVKCDEHGKDGPIKLGRYIRNSRDVHEGRVNEYDGWFTDHYRLHLRKAEQKKNKIKQEDNCTTETPSPTENWRKKCRPLGVRKLPKTITLPDVILVPWGTGSNTNTATQLINTCPIDNSLTILTMLHSKFESVRRFLEEPTQEHNFLATTVTQVVQYVRMRNFNAAKLLWLSGVVNRHLSCFPHENGAFNLLGCEDELGLLVLEPFLKSFAISRTCEDHGLVFESNGSISAMGIIERTPVEILQQLKPLPFEEDIPCRRHSKMQCEKLLTSNIIRRSGLAPFLIITPHAPPGFEHTLSMAPNYADVFDQIYDLVAVTVRRDGDRCLSHFYAFLLIENVWYVADGYNPPIVKYNPKEHKFNVLVSLWYVKQ